MTPPVIASIAITCRELSTRRFFDAKNSEEKARDGEGGGDVTDVLWGHSEHITVIEQKTLLLTYYANICILFEPLNEIGSALFSEKLVSTKSKTPMQAREPKIHKGSFLCNCGIAITVAL